MQGSVIGRGSRGCRGFPGRFSVVRRARDGRDGWRCACGRGDGGRRRKRPGRQGWGRALRRGRMCRRGVRLGARRRGDGGCRSARDGRRGSSPVRHDQGSGRFILEGHALNHWMRSTEEVATHGHPEAHDHGRDGTQRHASSSRRRRHQRMQSRGLDGTRERRSRRCQHILAVLVARDAWRAARLRRGAWQLRAHGRRRRRGGRSVDSRCAALQTWASSRSRRPASRMRGCRRPRRSFRLPLPVTSRSRSSREDRRNRC